MGQGSFWSKVLNVFLFVCLAILAISIIFPMLWILISGFKTNREFFLHPWSLPHSWQWENFVAAWHNGVAQYFLNSVQVTFVSIVLVLAFSAFASYALSRFDFKGKKIIFLVILSGLMLAPQVSVISLFKMLQTIHLFNTYWALVIPYVAFQIPFAVFLMRAYFLSLPREIEDAAYIDGCNSWTAFWRVILPMSKPIVLTTGLLTGMFFWNEFLFALVFIESPNLRTIPVGLMNLQNQLGTNYGILTAGLFLATIPMIVIFILFQKHFMRALSEGGLKG